MLLQLSELVNAEGYSDWIRLVSEFTLKSLHSWKVDYLLCPVKKIYSNVLQVNSLICISDMTGDQIVSKLIFFSFFLMYRFLLCDNVSYFSGLAAVFTTF